jgi:phosphoribosylformimino-5-aminoimidazole carboxamide ribotide isomerase
MLKREQGSLGVVPAIDLLDGRVVRLREGRYDQVTSYAVDPLECALGFAAQGATLLHVVDLSAARDGVRPAAHRDVVRDLVDHSGMAVQLGGGIRDEKTLYQTLELGVARVMVGTFAADSPGAVGRIAAKTARVAVAADVRDGTVRAAGWVKDTGVAAARFVRGLADAGVRDFLVTAIDRDGTDRGPDTALLSALRPGIPGLLLAAGGIRTTSDVEAVAAAGADAAVIGRALYDGSLTVLEASASVRSSPTESPS